MSFAQSDNVIWHNAVWHNAVWHNATDEIYDRRSYPHNEEKWSLGNMILNDHGRYYDPNCMKLWLESNKSRQKKVK
jgi:hypothetical protein